MALTPRGIGALAAAVVLAVVGGLTGTEEFVLAALALAVLLVGGAVQATARHRRSAGLSVTVTLGRSIVPVGVPVDVTVVVAGAVGPVRVEDPDRCWADGAVPRTGRSAAESLDVPAPSSDPPWSLVRSAPTTRRGIHTVRGPRAFVMDSYRLVACPLGHGPSASLTVHPVPLVVPVDPSLLIGHPGSEETTTPSARGPRDGGGELAGVRPYQAGDRLRLLHWPAMARTGELMVRDFEAAGPRQVTVVVDTRVGLGDLAVERSVAAAAGVGLEILGRGAQLDLWTIDGHHLVVAPGAGAAAVLLGGLAALPTGDRPGWSDPRGPWGRRRRGGADPSHRPPDAPTGAAGASWADVALVITCADGTASLPVSLGHAARVVVS